MELIRIATDGHDVLSAGTVITFESKPLEFTFGPPEERLRLIIRFSEDSEKEKGYFEARTENKTELELILFNTKDLLNFGSDKPLLVGSLGGRKFFINLSVAQMSAKQRTLHYTFYLGAEV